MIGITCFIGRLRGNIDLNFPLTLFGQSIPEYFSRGSTNRAGNPVIDLRMNMSRFNESIISSNRPTTVRFLQEALARLTLNPSTGPVSRIGLIIADEFEPGRGTLGLMFDKGFNPSGWEPVPDNFIRVAREGCAIFLTPITSLRPGLSDRRKEIVFTCIHELGHIFNLRHIESPSNFLSTSPVEAPFGAGACRFHGDHRRLLVRANFDENVMPGGSDFGSAGAFGPVANDPFRSISNQSDLQLKISVSQKEFWFFEPIELDIIVTSTEGQYSLPNEIDPGYDLFIIHITRPDGTSFRYKSPRIYCRNIIPLVITPDKSFLRDISIFGQSGSHTFQEPGEYSIQCFFDAGSNLRLVSNKLSVFVQPPTPRNAYYRLAEKTLTSFNPALLLYHRSGNFSWQTVQTLTNLSKKKRKDDLSQNIQYALAKYKTAKKNKLNHAQLENIKRLSNNSLDSGKLGKARIKNLMNLKSEYSI